MQPLTIGRALAWCPSVNQFLDEIREGRLTDAAGFVKTGGLVAFLRSFCGRPLLIRGTAQVGLGRHRTLDAACERRIFEEDNSLVRANLIAQADGGFFALPRK